MKIKFKTFTEEFEYNILKNINFRNTQNYINNNNINNINEFSLRLDSFELSIFIKILWFFIILSWILLYFMIYFKVNLHILIPLLVLLIPYVQKLIIFSRRKRKYFTIKIHHNINYYLVIHKIWWKIVTKFY